MKPPPARPPAKLPYQPPRIRKVKLAADELAVAGDPEECQARLASFEGAADRVILGGAWVGPSEERLRSNHALIVERFGPARA